MTMAPVLFAGMLMSVTSMDALRYLEDNSPACDQVQVYDDLLAGDAGLALLARDSLAWGAIVPDSIFLRYVLPVRVSQEPLTEWRPVLFDELVPLVQDAPDIQTAAVRVLAWCDSTADFMQTQRRDQSPLVTMSSGTGRCEELTILQMDALRAVCIPCRQVYTPWWMVCDNNHAWTEVWTPEGWVSTESGAAVDSLTQPAWFTENARRAALVVAVVQDSVPDAVVRRGNASLINVTTDYAPTGRLAISGEFGGSVSVSIVNWGALRPLLRLSRTSTSAALGEGVYALTWGWPVRVAIVEVEAGVTTTVDPSMGGEMPALTLLNLEGGQ